MAEAWPTVKLVASVPAFWARSVRVPSICVQGRTHAAGKARRSNELSLFDLPDRDWISLTHTAVFLVLVFVFESVSSVQ